MFKKKNHVLWNNPKHFYWIYFSTSWKWFKNQIKNNIKENGKVSAVYIWSMKVRFSFLLILLVFLWFQIFTYPITWTPFNIEVYLLWAFRFWWVTEKFSIFKEKVKRKQWATTSNQVILMGFDYLFINSNYSIYDLQIILLVNQN